MSNLVKDKVDLINICKLFQIDYVYFKVKIIEWKSLSKGSIKKTLTISLTISRKELNFITYFFLEKIISFES